MFDFGSGRAEAWRLEWGEGAQPKGKRKGRRDYPPHRGAPSGTSGRTLPNVGGLKFSVTIALELLLGDRLAHLL